MDDWISRYDGPTDGFDGATDVAVDADGNIYVTGLSWGVGTGQDYTTIKYNRNGVKQWEAIYNGPANGWDESSRIAIDRDGNVYVTGSSDGGSTGLDFATIKYDRNGIEQWVARYNGPGNGNDAATAIAVDAQGNVYVTGGSVGIGTGSDYVTVKYDRDGIQQWVARYDGTAHAYDESNAIAVDADGNVYVTGGATQVDTDFDYTTIKYDRNGRELWVKTYNGPGNGKDEAAAIAIDAQGNVYVTGYSYGGTSTGFDYATIKYDRNGSELWVKRYNGVASANDEGTAIAVDAAGNVYVTGGSEGLGTDHDYATVKYDRNGSELWVTRYDGPGNGWDGATAIVVDTAGNVYVTGASFGLGTDLDYATVKYDGNGTQLQVARYDGPVSRADVATSMALDSQANVYVVGFSDGGLISNYATVKYDRNLNLQWPAARYTRAPMNREDRAAAIAVDAQGNIYVTGGSDGVATGFDYVTIKYDVNRNRQWLARYNGPLRDGEDRATAMAVDAQGNVYVTGFSHGGPTGFDYDTVKYSQDGRQLWHVRYNGPGNGEDRATAIAVDAQGNVYVTGFSYGGSETGLDYATIKYDSNGRRLWLARYNGVGSGEDRATAIAVDAQGNVYVTGFSYGGSETGLDYATIKYDGNGMEQWVRTYNGPGNGEDRATAMALDADGNIYVTGFSYGGSSTGLDYATIKYDRNGTDQWVKTYDGPGNGEDRAMAMVVNTNGVYVTGFSYGGSSTGLDYATIKYDRNGNQQWVQRYDGPAHKEDKAAAIAVNTNGIYVTGSSDGGSTGLDYATIKYNENGVQQWVKRYNGPANANDEGTAIGLDAAGNVYVTGASNGISTSYDYATVGYSQ